MPGPGKELFFSSRQMKKNDISVVSRGGTN
jgi:hypothetical protein